MIVSQDKVWVSKIGQFDAVYRGEVERAVNTLDRRSLEVFLRLIDYHIFTLGPQALAAPERATELAGRARALYELQSEIAGVYNRPLTSVKQEEGEDSDE